MKTKIRRILPGENFRVTAIAACIGLAAGAVNILFRTTVALVHEHIFVGGSALLGLANGGLYLLLLPLIPVCGMVLLIPLSLLFPGEVNGYGFPKFLRQVNLEGGIVRFRTIVIKILSCALTIGTGGSAGVEGPIAQVGGAVGSQVGQFFRVSGSRMKVFIAAGCAGGVAAMFNAPIAGVFFAAEIVLLGTYEIGSFAALVISSAMATVVSRGYYGGSPAFPIPAYEIVNSFVEIPLYSLMGVVMGLVAVLHINVFYTIRDRFAALGLHPQLKPLLGALAVGLLAIGFPQVMGDGYHYLEVVLSGQGVLWVMGLLIFLKIAATALTLGSGGAGGVFAPALFIGGVTGGSFGAIAHYLLPQYTANSGAYAAVGIGAFLAAATHAPLTAIFLLFEMTGNYLIIIPIMLSSIIGTVVAARLNPDSIDTVDFSRDGIDLHEGREISVMKSIKVGRVVSEDVDFISEQANVDQLLTIFSMTRDSFYFPVIDESGRMIGVVSLQDVKSILHDEELRLSARVGNICTRKVVVLTPEDNLHTAMSLFDAKGLEEIPVVEDTDNRWVVGMLKRRDALAAYNKEVIRRGISERSAQVFSVSPRQ
ncbi:chloride channel protein [Thiovibrio frasassiensis]|jgi:CIC family chloride channel protein|uniref:Chloride channel protein n=1 Tax=Thiovibrio frasassiensis TaxID=2984131 RepID=A0A9X4MPU3_9BACT|nr:chloride channel protein [Thiovibrio frasassiensis]MDG4476657.1 chloride channel protein [Thiovibrio frasassiensis]